MADILKCNATIGHSLYSVDADEGVLDCRALWRHLANATERSLYDGSAALCQIALTT